jgi:hypothetical protein
MDDYFDQLERQLVQLTADALTDATDQRSRSSAPLTECPPSLALPSRSRRSPPSWC